MEDTNTSIIDQPSTTDYYKKITFDTGADTTDKLPILYKDLVFEIITYHKHCMMDLYKLPPDINLRCNNVIEKNKMSEKRIKDNCAYFILFPLYDIFFAVELITGAEYILKKELCFINGFTKIKDIEFGVDNHIPVYLFEDTPMCVKVLYSDISKIPDTVEMVFSIGHLQYKYKRDMKVIFPDMNE